MLLSIIRMINSFREYHRNLAELSQLSDRELADIGIDRRFGLLQRMTRPRWSTEK